MVWCSHPIKEFDNEEILWNMGTGYDAGHFHYSVLKFSDNATYAKEVARLPCRRKDSPCYMHSFGLTSKYVVMLEQPLFVNKTATNGVNLHHHLKWKPHLPVSL